MEIYLRYCIPTKNVVGAKEHYRTLESDTSPAGCQLSNAQTDKVNSRDNTIIQIYDSEWANQLHFITI